MSVYADGSFDPSIPRTGAPIDSFDHSEVNEILQAELEQRKQQEYTLSKRHSQAKLPALGAVADVQPTPPYLAAPNYNYSFPHPTLPLDTSSTSPLKSQTSNQSLFTTNPYQSALSPSQRTLQLHQTQPQHPYQPTQFQFHQPSYYSPSSTLTVSSSTRILAHHSLQEQPHPASLPYYTPLWVPNLPTGEEIEQQLIQKMKEEEAAREEAERQRIIMTRTTKSSSNKNKQHKKGNPKAYNRQNESSRYMQPSDPANPSPRNLAHCLSNLSISASYLGKPISNSTLRKQQWLINGSHGSTSTSLQTISLEQHGSPHRLQQFGITMTRAEQLHHISSPLPSPSTPSTSNEISFPPPNYSTFSSANDQSTSLLPHETEYNGYENEIADKRAFPSKHRITLCAIFCCLPVAVHADLFVTPKVLNQESCFVCLYSDSRKRINKTLWKKLR